MTDQIHRLEHEPPETAASIAVPHKQEPLKVDTWTQIPPCDPISLRFDGICVDVKAPREAGSCEAESPLDFNKALKPRRTRLYRCLQYLGLGCASEKESKRRILLNLSGEFRPCEMTAVMGASGAGKSTLLSVLSGRLTPTEGTVFINGQNATREHFQSLTAFVHQQDMFFPKLTAEEHLDSQLALRLPRSTYQRIGQERLQIFFNEMSLFKCRKTMIGLGTTPGGLSGGERKRLGIASELARFPGLLLLDEPTTGLDSSLALSVAVVLRQLADSGRTVVATIHQPSAKIFEMFDKVLLLAEGQIVYAGDRLGSLEWFRCLQLPCPAFTNPADFLIKILSVPSYGEARSTKLSKIGIWADRWNREGKAFLDSWAIRKNEGSVESSTLGILLSESALGAQRKATSVSKTWPLPASSDPTTRSTSVTIQQAISEELPVTANKIESVARLSWLRQVSILCRRALIEGKRDRTLVVARGSQTFVLAFLYGFLFFRLNWTKSGASARLGGLYTLFINQCMAGAFTVCHVFIAEKPVIQREYNSGLLSASAHMVAKMLADLTIQLVFPLIFATVGYWLMGLNDDFCRFCIVTSLVWLVSNTAMSVGYFASGVASSAETSSVICNLTLLPLNLFGGFMVRLQDSPSWISWIQHISFLKYGFRHAAYTVFGNEAIYVTQSLTGDPDTSLSYTIDGTEFVESKLGLSKPSWALSFGMLLLLFLLYRSLATLAYSFTLQRNRRRQDN